MLRVILSMFLICGTAVHSLKTRMVTHRVVAVYQNKSLIEFPQLENLHLNRTYHVTRIKVCLKVPLTEETKLNTVAHIIKNNKPLRFGVNFNIDFCKGSTVTNSYGLDNILKGFGFERCPVKVGCYKNDVNFDNIDVPTGILADNYMIEETLFTANRVKAATLQWWGQVVVTKQ